MKLFAAAHTIFLLPIIIGLCVVLIMRYMWQKQRASQLAAPAHHKRLLLNFSLRTKKLKVFLLMSTLILLQLVLLRPQWDQKETSVVQEGRDLIIALDVSRSMLASDCMPNRLACAKKKIMELVRTLAVDRLALIVFSGEAWIQCPLTRDFDAFAMFLDELDVETTSSGTTALDAAISKTLEIFSDIPAKKSKLLALFTDGEDFSLTIHNQALKQQIHDLNVQISAVGIGTPQGAPIPLFDEQGNVAGHQHDEHGAIVISKLNEATLQAIIHDTGGLYIPMTADTRDVNTLVQWVMAHEKESYDNKNINYLEEKYYYFAAPALMLLLIEWLL